MRQTVQDAAKELRGSLIRNGPSPAAFRAALSGIRAEDRDTWLDLLWDIDELPEDDPLLPPGCVPYLPCPVATVLEAVRQAAVTSNDVFVDVGAGLGRAVVLTHLLTGAGGIGLEIQPELVRAARGRAAWLNLSRVRMVEGDAVDLIRRITIGTVFFLYCPFGQDRLQHVLDDLEHIARTRPIRVCCVGFPPLDRPWLAPVPSTSVEVAVYRSTLHPALTHPA
jgi:SAM-dependent methyltransferase